jgi:hypothetical protein
MIKCIWNNVFRDSSSNSQKNGHVVAVFYLLLLRALTLSGLSVQWPCSTGLLTRSSRSISTSSSKNMFLRHNLKGKQKGKFPEKKNMAGAGTELICDISIFLHIFFSLALFLSTSISNILSMKY